MRGRVLRELVVPACEGRAFEVLTGQVLRIHQIEGGQVGDCVFFNARDYRESFHVGQSWALNGILGTGTAKSFTHFYSKPPRENVMLTVVEDTVRNHWGNMGGRCTARLYELRDGLTEHRSCQENLADALAPYGVDGDDIIDVFNVFMDVELTPDGGFRIRPTKVTRDDYIDLRAEMDILAAISACPANTSPTNAGTTKPLGIRIFAN
jgi:uncharacterized protein